MKFSKFISKAMTFGSWPCFKSSNAASQTRLRQRAVKPGEKCGNSRHGMIGQAIRGKIICGLRLPQCAAGHHVENLLFPQYITNLQISQPGIGESSRKKEPEIFLYQAYFTAGKHYYGCFIM